MYYFINFGWDYYGVFLFIIVLMFLVALGDYLEKILSWVKLQWKEASPLKKIYIAFAGVIGFALFVLFFVLYSQLILIPFSLSSITISDLNAGFALAFLGTITGGVAIFTGFIAILRTEINERQSQAAESRSQAAHDQNEITKRQNDLNERQNDLIEQQNTIYTEQNRLTTAGSKTTERQADVAEKQAKIAEKQADAAKKQADTAEKGLLDDRFNKAIERLGANNEKGEPILEMRVGALYVLERIAQENISDHIRIMEMFCTYIQQNSPRDIKNEPEDDLKPLRTDIQTALTIIGQRDRWPENKKRLKIELDQKYWIDLRNCNLHGARFNTGNFNNARFNRSNLSNTAFSHTRLVDARFLRTNLRNAMFFNTDMTDVKIRYANLTYAKIHDTDMSNAATDYLYAHIADFSGNTNIITQEQIDVMYCGIGVEIPNGLTRPDHWTEDNLSYADFMETYREWLKRNGRKRENDPYIR